MHCCVLTDTFPNRLQPWRGPYNRRQIECLGRHCELTVINPIPWTYFLASHRRLGLLGEVDDVLAPIPMYHPVLWYLPKVGRNRSWRGVLRAARRTLKKRGIGPFDLLLATFAYPHGVAAMHLSQQLGVPYVLKVRGSDLHSLPDAGPQREMVAEALRGAAGVVAVSGNLSEIAVDLGAAPERVHVLTNGIDADQFAMIPREEARAQLGVDASEDLILFVGALRRVKGVDILLEVFRATGDHGFRDRNVRLALAGDGPLRGEDGSDFGVPVEWLGHIPREEVVLWMNAADVLVLPSRNEGCPNVVLEALACGTPVVGSAVGAVPDLLEDEVGIVVPSEDAAALAEGVVRALDREWDREAIRAMTDDMSWEENGRTLSRILGRAANSVREGVEDGHANRDGSGAHGGGSPGRTLPGSLRRHLWLPKALGVNLISRLPGHERIHYGLQKLHGRHRLDADEMSRRALELFRLLRHQGLTIQDADVLEIGTGWFPFVPVIAHLLGARHVVTVDIHPWLRLPNLRRTVESLGPLVGRIAAGMRLGTQDLARRHSHLLSIAREAEVLPDVLRAAGIDYRCPCDVTDSPFPTGSFDVAFSSNVLEHVPPGELLKIHRETRRILRENGLAVHRLNPGDHYVELTGSTVNFLRFPESAWRWLGGSGLSYHNRLRSCEHAELLTLAGLGLCLWADAVDRKALRTELGRSVVPVGRFREMPDEFLAAYYTWFVVGKGVDRAVAEPVRVDWIDTLLERGSDQGSEDADTHSEISATAGQPKG